jgi:hypothetical protein
MFHRGSFRRNPRRSLSVDDISIMMQGDVERELSDKILTLRTKIFKYKQKKNLTEKQCEVLHELESSLKRLTELQYKKCGQE